MRLSINKSALCGFCQVLKVLLLNGDRVASVLLALIFVILRVHRAQAVVQSRPAMKIFKIRREFREVITLESDAYVDPASSGLCRTAHQRYAAIKLLLGHASRGRIAAC